MLFRSLFVSSCVAAMPNVDDDTNSGTSSKLVTNGKEVRVTLDLGYPALLVSGDTWDNNSLTVCDTRLVRNKYENTPSFAASLVWGYGCEFDAF